MAALLMTRTPRSGSRRSAPAGGLARLPALALALLAGCFAGCCADHTDISGTYAGEAKGRYQPKGGAAVDFTLPRDVITVKMVSRHYQYSTLQITVRGCVLATDGGETAWSVSTRNNPRCSFDVPGVGPVEISLDGGLTKTPSSRSSPPEAVHLSLHGENDRVQMLSYSLHAEPPP